MLTLIAGGASSGKSAYAETLAVSALQEAPEIRPDPSCDSPEDESARHGLIYLATMKRDGKEALARIAHHRKQRAHRGFTTIEQPSEIGAAAIPENSVVLLEDIGNLCANELFDGESKIVFSAGTGAHVTEKKPGRMQNVTATENTDGDVHALVRGITDETISSLAQEIADGIRALEKRCRRLIVVTVEAGSGGTEYGPETLAYLRLLGRVNRLLAERADNVCEVVCGIPVYHKGAGFQNLPF